MFRASAGHSRRCGLGSCARPGRNFDRRCCSCGAAGRPSRRRDAFHRGQSCTGACRSARGRRAQDRRAFPPTVQRLRRFSVVDWHQRRSQRAGERRQIPQPHHQGAGELRRHNRRPVAARFRGCAEPQPETATRCRQDRAWPRANAMASPGELPRNGPNLRCRRCRPSYSPDKV